MAVVFGNKYLCFHSEETVVTEPKTLSARCLSKMVTDAWREQEED